MRRNKNILISAPFGYSIKNFLFSSFWQSENIAKSQIYILTPTPKVYQEHLEKAGIRNVEVIAFNFNKIKFSRTFSMLWQVYKNRFLESTRSNTQKVKWRVLREQSLPLFLVKKVAVFFSLIIPEPLIKRMLYAAIPDTDMKIPSKLDIWLSLAPSFDFDLLVYKKLQKSHRDTEKIAFVHSWDNLSSKGSLICDYQKVLVWGKLMKQEVVEKLGLPASRVIQVGMPQYDIWRNAKFAKPRKKYFLYTTGHPDTIPNEKRYVLDVLKIIERSYSDHYLILRVHPNDDIKNYQELTATYPFFRVEDPGKRTEATYDKWSPEEKDMFHFGELLAGADAVINIASTLILDASYFSTPVICLDYDKSDKLALSIRRFYKYEHLLRLLQEEGVYMCQSRQDLDKLMKDAVLRHPLRQTQERMYAGHDEFRDGMSGKRLGDSLR